MEVIIVLIIIGIILSSFSSSKSGTKNSNSSSSINSNQQKWYSCGKCGHQEFAYSKPTTCGACREWGTF